MFNGLRIFLVLFIKMVFNFDNKVQKLIKLEWEKLNSNKFESWLFLSMGFLKFLCPFNTQKLAQTTRPKIFLEVALRKRLRFFFKLNLNQKTTDRNFPTLPNRKTKLVSYIPGQELKAGVIKTKIKIKNMEISLLVVVVVVAIFPRWSFAVACRWTAFKLYPQRLSKNFLQFTLDYTKRFKNCAQIGAKKN